MRAILLAVALAATVSQSGAADWISTEAAEKLAKEMRANKMRLIDLDCMSDPASTEDTVFLMDWEANPDNVDWSWREADALTVRGYLRDFETQKFRLVTHRTFSTGSGKERACALWHR